MCDAESVRFHPITKGMGFLAQSLYISSTFCSIVIPDFLCYDSG